MIDLSIIIPSRNDEYLEKTIKDLLQKAEKEIEIIVVLDGYWTESYVDSPKVLYMHHGTIHNHKGMRESINAGIRISKGQYIMKIDEHCMVDQGYDRKLIENYEEGQIVIPRRYRLDPDKWEIIEDGRPPIDYMQIDYPYQRPQDKTCGLHGAEWRERARERKKVMIDDTPSMQGSCYFSSRAYWDKVIGELDSQNYGTFTQEAQEIGMKAWLSGGSVVVNKKTWYAHYHKGKRGKGYGFSTEQYKRHTADMEKGRLFCINNWLYTKEYKYDWEWFINTKFPDMPGWGGDWQGRIARDRDQDYSTTGYKNDYWLSNLRK